MFNPAWIAKAASIVKPVLGYLSWKERHSTPDHVRAAYDELEVAEEEVHQLLSWMYMIVVRTEEGLPAIRTDEQALAAATKFANIYIPTVEMMEIGKVEAVQAAQQ